MHDSTHAATHAATHTARRRALWILGALLIAYVVAFYFPEQQMTSGGGPGTLKFELVGTAERAAAYMDQWGSEGQNGARWGLWIDYGYMVVYAAFFALLARAAADRAANRGRATLAKTGRWIWTLPIAAAAFDAIENAGLLAIVYGSEGGLAPALATTCASLKFLLLLTTQIYLIVVVVKTSRSHPAQY